ncbi:MAG: hypothetical protein IID51_10995 [Proteobacteria bacterium]|nr:hypothetical protein [Pseudomonadota bacterium]
MCLDGGGERRPGTADLYMLLGDFDAFDEEFQIFLAEGAGAVLKKPGQRFAAAGDLTHGQARHGQGEVPLFQRYEAAELFSPPLQLLLVIAEVFRIASVAIGEGIELGLGHADRGAATGPAFEHSGGAGVIAVPAALAGRQHEAAAATATFGYS